MLLVTIYQHLFFTTFILYVFISVIQLNYKNKLQLNYCLAGIFIAGGYNFLYFWAYSLGLLKYVSVLLNTEICFAFLLGPFFYFYMAEMTGVKKYSKKVILVHFIPFVISTIIITALNLSNPSFLSDYIRLSLFFPDYSGNSTILVINSFCDASITLYTVFSLYNVLILIRIKKMTHEIKLLLIFIIIYLLAAMVLLLSNILENSILNLTGITFFCIMPTYYMIFSFKYPDFALKVIKEAKNLRYKKSMLKKPDSNLIESRLIQLMEEDKVYTDAELTLNSLSEQLMIPPHELSYILNNKFDKNFNSFVNSYRIKEAKELLAQVPKRSIVEIAFTVGFNSASSFYEYFERETNKSPGDYRHKK